MNEPATVLTDYLLAGLASYVAWRLTRSGSAPSSPARLWGASFFVLAAAALAGGTWHAIHPGSLPWLRHNLWSLTYLSIGVADLLLLAGAARAALPAGLRRLGFAAVAGKFLGYAVVLLWFREFRHVGYEYALTLLLLLAAALDLLRRHEPAAGFLLAGVLVSFAGGLVQTLRLAPHPQFNHNDLFHVIQMAGLWLLFRAGLRLRDRRGAGGGSALRTPSG